MMKPDDFEFVSRLIKSKSGLVLSQDKTYLLESRLMPIARKRGLKDLTELIGTLRGGDRNLVEEVVDAMTTNESFFFRDTKPFDQFRHVVLPHMIKARASKKHLRIWCAAASSGQEPYSLAMILDEFKSQLAGWRIDIIGTDISREILTKARAGLYSQFEVQRGLPISLLVKYFQKKEDQWQISADLRSRVQYKEFNLLDDFRPLGQFDVVYCRNVLIYFDQPTKSDVLSRISALMPDDGFLFLGGAETVLGISDKFKPLARQRGIYQLSRPGAPEIDLTALEKAQAGAAAAAAGGAGAGGLAFPKPKHMQTGAGSSTTGGAARPAAGATGTATARPGTSSFATQSNQRPAGGASSARPTTGTGSAGSTYSRPSSSSGASSSGPSSSGAGSTARPGTTGTTGSAGGSGSTYRRPLGTGSGAGAGTGGTTQRPRPGTGNTTGSSGTTRPSTTFDRSRFGKTDDKK